MSEKQPQRKTTKQPNGSSGKDTNKAPSKSPHRPWWKTALMAVAMLIWTGVSVIASQLIVGNLMLAIMGADNFSQPVWTAVYSALSYALALALVIFVPLGVSARRQRKPEPNDASHIDKSTVKEISRDELGLRGWPRWLDIGLAPVGFVVYLLFAGALTFVFSQFAWFDAKQAQELGFSISSTGADRIVAFLILTIVAPIAEEIIFRGWLYGKLRKCFNGALPNEVGMIISNLLVSILFGVVHLQWNVGVNVFALSVVLCAMREITGTIYAGILLHMIKNGVAFYLLYSLGIT